MPKLPVGRDLPLDFSNFVGKSETSFDSLGGRVSEVLVVQRQVHPPVARPGAEDEVLLHRLEELGQGLDRGGSAVALDAGDRRLGGPGPDRQLLLTQPVADARLAQQFAWRAVFERGRLDRFRVGIGHRLNIAYPRLSLIRYIARRDSVPGTAIEGGEGWLRRLESGLGSRSSSAASGWSRRRGMPWRAAT